MRELNLFSGCGGGVLAGKLLGWKTKGYVEINEYCQKIIAARIKDGIYDQAPIFSDIRAFNDQGYAMQYRGMVDVVSAGFPSKSKFTFNDKKKQVVTISDAYGQHVDRGRHDTSAIFGIGKKKTEIQEQKWWNVEPRIRRVAHGVPDRTNRLKALGNGQVPVVAATAWRLLTENRRR